MINLRKTAVAIQRLENEAAEKVGMRLLMMEDARLYGKKSEEYAGKLADLLVRDCEDEIRAAAKLAIPIADAVGDPTKTLADLPGNEYIAYFKIAAVMAIRQMADRLKLKIARNRTIGVTDDVISSWRADPKSVLNIERANLTKTLKREMAGVLNRIFQGIIVKEYR